MLLSRKSLVAIGGEEMVRKHAYTKKPLSVWRATFGTKKANQSSHQTSVKSLTIQPQLDTELPAERQPELQAEPSALELKVSLLQRQAAGIVNGTASPEFEAALQKTGRSGQPLDNALRAQIEPIVGADFDGVKVHTDAQADRMNRAIQAKAFTTGQNIFFARGTYDPGSHSGQELIAHELTHVMQQTSGALQRQQKVQAQAAAIADFAITPIAGSELSIQRLMTAKEFKQATPGTLLHPRKRIKKIDGPLKKIDESGMDSILLSELLEAINGWLAVASEDSERKPTVLQLREQVLEEQAKIAASLSSEIDPDKPPQTRSRSKAFSAEVTGAKKKYGSDFSDFDSKQFRVSGSPPNRRIEEVKRRKMEDGTVVYYTMGLVTRFKGKAPMVAPYPDPIPLGDWYPQVTHINGMQVAPKSGILSASALQNSVNDALKGKTDVAFGQQAVDLLYTYSAQRGGVITDLIDCIKGKLQVDDDATEKQEELMLDAVRRQQRVTVSAHSRGTIKTDNAVRNVHEELAYKDEYPKAKAALYDSWLEYWQANDPGIMPPEVLAEIACQKAASSVARDLMNEYIQLVYAGNAVQHPSDFIDIDMYVGGLDFVSMFVGTYSEIGRNIDAAIGTGGSKDSKVHSVGGTKGHGFTSNYVSSVGGKIAEDISKR